MPGQKFQPVAMGPPGALARPDWQPGAEFTAADLRLDQRYKQQRIRRHLRLVHGWGVVCGLTVVAAGENWYLFVCPGYGIGPCGDEIVVLTPYRFNVHDYLWTRPQGGNVGNIVWIAIEAIESPEGVAAPPCGCGCNPCNCSQTSEQAVRIADGFRIVVSWTPPILYQGNFDVCSGGNPVCPPCPETCALTLARVSLPRSNRAILNSAIDNLRSRGS